MNPPPLAIQETTNDLFLAEAALEGDARAVEKVLEILRSPQLSAALRGRGATSTEAEDLVGDLVGDCFGGTRAKGGLHRLLGRYNGACPLGTFLRHVALNRFISVKRKQSLRRPAIPHEEDDRDPMETLSSESAGVAGDAALIALLRDALGRAFASVDSEKLLLYRLIHSHGVPQKRVAAIWGWHESKVSRAMEALRTDLQRAILDETREADPWLELQWDDFISLCGESVDLFGR